MGKRPLISALEIGQAERYMFRIGITSQSNSEDAPAFPFIFDAIMGFGLNRNDHFDALLGMDILRHCTFQIDRNFARLRFRY